MTAPRPNTPAQAKGEDALNRVDRLVQQADDLEKKAEHARRQMEEAHLPRTMHVPKEFNEGGPLPGLG